MDDKPELDVKRSNKHVLEWVAVILAAIPIAGYLGYLVSYLRELGYASRFGFPSEFIEIAWTSIPTAVAFIVGYIVVAFVPFLVIHQWLVSREGKWPSVWWRPLIRTVAISGPISLYLIAVEPWARNEVLRGVLPLMTAFGLVFFGLLGPLVSYRGVEGYRQKLEALEAKGFGISESVRRFALAFLVSGLLVILLALPYQDGRARAKAQRDFWVPSTHPQSVVLRIYGDDLVCAPYDNVTEKIEEVFFIIRLDDEPRPELTLTHLSLKK